MISSGLLYSLERENKNLCKRDNDSDDEGILPTSERENDSHDDKEGSPTNSDDELSTSNNAAIYWVHPLPGLCCKLSVYV